MSKPSRSKEMVMHQPEFVTGDALSFPILKILKGDGTLYKGAALPEIDKAKALKIYDAFLFFRIFDEKMLAAQRQGRISFYMTSTGEEATHIGSAASLEEEDMIFAQYREPGPLYYRGFRIADFMNQLFANEADLGKGRQMPNHYGSKKLHYMTISSPLSTQIPQATGYAYGQKLEGNKNCTLCYFGEGAASEGDFHAAMNMATVYKVPVIFFCRNNHYAISTPSEQQFAADGIAPRGVGYGMQTIRVDGNDVLAVMKATEAARKLAIEQNEPTLIEAMTYRLGAHSTSDDPAGYRSRKEEDRWRKNDPVLRMKNWLFAQGWWSEKEEQEALDTKQEEVRAEMKKAEKVPAPELASLITDVYDSPPWHLQDQLNHLEKHIRKYPKDYPKSSWRFDHD